MAFSNVHSCNVRWLNFRGNPRSDADGFTAEELEVADVEAKAEVEAPNGHRKIIVTYSYYSGGACIRPHGFLVI